MTAHGTPAARELARARDDRREPRIVVVVADPGLEQVAEDVELAGAARVALDERRKNRRIVSGSPASRCRSEMNSVGHGDRELAEDLDALDRDRLDGHVAVERAAGPGRAMADVVDDFHALDDLAEHGVAPARRSRIQVEVVARG